jgi:Tfp pilus assembly protein PilX
MRKENGQILLIVILTVVIALTIGLSVASRTITNLKLSKQNEESQRAFQAAEAGLSQAIQQIQSNTGDGNASDITLENKSNFTTTTTQVGGKDPFLLNGDQPVPQDVGLDVWLSKYPDYSIPHMNGNITLYWVETKVQTECVQNAGNKTDPAVEVFVLSGNTTSPTPAKYLFDPCPSRTPGSESPDLIVNGGPIPGTSFKYKKTFNVSDGLIMKIIPIYNSGKIGIVTSDSNGFPSQGTIISSRGVSGDTQRKVNYYQSYPQIPDELFPYAIISQ